MHRACCSLVRRVRVEDPVERCFRVVRLLVHPHRGDRERLDGLVQTRSKSSSIRWAAPQRRLVVRVGYLFGRRGPHSSRGEVVPQLQAKGAPFRGGEEAVVARAHRKNAVALDSASRMSRLSASRSKRIQGWTPLGRRSMACCAARTKCAGSLSSKGRSWCAARPDTSTGPAFWSIPVNLINQPQRRPIPRDGERAGHHDAADRDMTCTDRTEALSSRLVRQR